MVVSAPLALAGCSDSGGEFSAYFDEEVDTSSPHDVGVYHFAAGQFGLAVQYFERATQRNPGAIESVNGLAAAYDRLGRFDLAERQYRRALSIDPLSVQTLNNLGYSYWLQGRHDLALTYLREAEELDGSSPVIATNLKNVAEAYQREGALAEVAKPLAPEPVQQAEAPAPVRETWIERTGPNIQTLVTRPALSLLAEAQRSDLPPQLLSYQGAAEELPASFMFGADAPAPSTLGKSARPAGPAQGAKQISPLREQAGVVGEPSLATLSAAADTAPSGLAKPYQKVAAGPPVQLRTKTEIPLQAAASANTAQTLGVRFDGEPLGPLEPSAFTPLDEQIASALELPKASMDEVASHYSRREGVAARSIAELAVNSEPVPEAADVVAPRIELANALGVEGMAARLRDYLHDRGLTVDSLSNAETFGRGRTMIFYRDEWRVYAMGLASVLPAAVVLEPREDVTGDIRIELGGDLLNFDRRLSASRGPVRDDVSG